MTQGFTQALSIPLAVSKGGTGNSTGNVSSLTGTTIGTTTNDNASSGQIGQIIESNIASGSAISLSNSTTANITSISLTAGDWNVWGNVVVVGAGGSVASVIDATISSTSATLSTAPNGGCYNQIRSNTTADVSYVLPTGTFRVSLASTTTYYLVVQAGFSVFGSATAYGYIGARRVR